MTRIFREKNKARAAEVQRGRSWPPTESIGFITRKGRVFHRDATCAHYRRAIEQHERQGTTPQLRETVTAGEARALDREPCATCWRGVSE